MTLTERRRSFDLSLGECARAANLLPADLSKIERGSCDPSDEQLGAIAAALKCSPEEIRAGLPSKEDIEKENKRWGDTLNAIAVVHEDAKVYGYGIGFGGSGEIECPICKGRLRYSVAGINGHIWGTCSTPDCVRWMS